MRGPLLEVQQATRSLYLKACPNAQGGRMGLQAIADGRLRAGARLSLDVVVLVVLLPSGEKSFQAEQSRHDPCHSVSV